MWMAPYHNILSTIQITLPKTLQLCKQINSLEYRNFQEPILVCLSQLHYFTDYFYSMSKDNSRSNLSSNTRLLLKNKLFFRFQGFVKEMSKNVFVLSKNYRYFIIFIFFLQPEIKALMPLESEASFENFMKRRKLGKKTGGRRGQDSDSD